MFSVKESYDDEAKKMLFFQMHIQRGVPPNIAQPDITALDDFYHTYRAFCFQ